VKFLLAIGLCHGGCRLPPSIWGSHTLVLEPETDFQIQVHRGGGALYVGGNQDSLLFLSGWAGSPSGGAAMGLTRGRQQRTSDECDVDMNKISRWAAENGIY